MLLPSRHGGGSTKIICQDCGHFTKEKTNFKSFNINTNRAVIVAIILNISNTKHGLNNNRNHFEETSYSNAIHFQNH